jgi:hypothetical protein
VPGIVQPDRAHAGPYRLHRWELPDDHPERRMGSINDDLMLTKDDEPVTDRELGPRSSVTGTEEGMRRADRGITT